MSLSTTTCAGFEYKPHIEEDAIRLLLLRPSQDFSAPIQCLIEHSSLSQYEHELINHYTALSYVWGDPNDTHTIFLDGKPVQVTKSLESALRHLREQGDGRVLRLWADALCINQADNTEKNRQVQQMGAIYATAHHTVIYLGSSILEIDIAFKALQLYQRRKSLSSRKGCLENSSPEEVHSIWNILKTHILTRPWFKRVWVFQELVMSHDPWVQFGRRRMRWADFCDISFAIGNQYVHATSHSPGPVSIDKTPELDALKPLQEMKTRRNRFHYTAKSNGYDSYDNSLLDLLSLRRGLSASDEKDLVFAHLGLASDYRKDPKAFRVNYTLTVPQVFAEAARYIIEQGAALDKVLEQISDIDISDRPPDRPWRQILPSWAPDWTRAKSSRKSPPIWSNHGNTEQPKVVPSFTLWTQIPMRLILQGRRVGALTRLSDTLSYLEYSPDEMSQAWIDVFDRHNFSQPLGDQNRRAIFMSLYNGLLQTIGLDLHHRRWKLSDVMKNPDMGWINYYKPHEIRVLDAIKVDNGSNNGSIGLHPMALISQIVLGRCDLSKSDTQKSEEQEIDLISLTQDAQVLNGHRLGLLNVLRQSSRPSFGLFSGSVKKNDWICTFPGLQKMYVCRPVEKHIGEDDGKHLIIVGECYIENETYSACSCDLTASGMEDFIFH